MTERQLAKRVQFWCTGPLAHLGLGHWDIQVRFVPDHPHGKGSASAAISTSKSYASAWLEVVEPRFNATLPIVQDKLLIHELLHLAFRDLDNTFEDAADHASSGARDAYNERWEHEEEDLIEALARAIATIYHGDSDAAGFIP